MNFEAFDRALSQLQRSLEYHGSESAAEDPGLREQFRNSAIQCFEFTFELAISHLTRALKNFISEPVMKAMTYREIVRAGSERGLIGDPEAWFRFRQMRNLTSHAYDAAKAEEVFSAVPGFFAAAKDLRLKLESLRA